jgi:transcriptional regulator with XRE-family HTH domain
MTMSDVVPLHGRMNESAYDAERARLRELYGDSRQEAGARFEQALALLFHRSGWTQEELAKKEGKSRTWIVYRLCFGKFLNFVTVVTNSDLTPNNLTERRFRGYWEQTEGGTERIRFQAVIKLMQADVTLTAGRRDKIGEGIKQYFADGKWHSLNRIAKKLDADIAHVDETVRRIRRNQTYKCKAEMKDVGTEPHCRIFKLDRTISSAEIAERLTPILEGLETEGRKNSVTMSVATVARLAGLLRHLLNEWSE